MELEGKTALVTGANSGIGRGKGLFRRILRREEAEEALGREQAVSRAWVRGRTAHLLRNSFY